MRFRWLVGVAVLLAAVGVPACGPGFDLEHDLEVTDVFSGWYDYGPVEGGLNKLVPSISFRLRNNGQTSVDRVQVTVAFWQDGAAGPLDERVLAGIDDEVEPGQHSEPILVRSDLGYTIAQPRGELFTHSQFVDFTARVFARRSGTIVPLGEFTVDRQIIPQAPTSAQ